MFGPINYSTNSDKVARPYMFYLHSFSDEIPSLSIARLYFFNERD